MKEKFYFYGIRVLLWSSCCNMLDWHLVCLFVDPITLAGLYILYTETEVLPIDMRRGVDDDCDPKRSNNDNFWEVWDLGRLKSKMAMVYCSRKLTNKWFPKFIFKQIDHKTIAITYGGLSSSAISSLLYPLIIIKTIKAIKYIIKMISLMY